MAAILGRDAEAMAIEAFLDRAAQGSAALVIEGPAGIGKSTLWLAGVAAARARGFGVLASRPAEGEQRLANVVIGDLFGEVPPEQLAALPPPRRRALEAALLRRDDSDVPVDPRTLSVALVTLVTRLSTKRPLLLAIDDDQWMDASSAATLSFALRRVQDRHVSLLLSRRSPESPPAALEETFDAEPVDRLDIGPLSVGALHALVHERLGVVLSRPQQVGLHEVSGGNPFYAIELARAQAGQPSAGSSAFTVPPSLERLVQVRLGALDDETRSALLLVAAHGRLPVEAVEALPVPAAALDRASRAGVTEATGGLVRFTHPLLASAIYEGAPERARRAAHRHLAGAVPDPVHRARHLALAAEGPDASLAQTIESVVGLAIDRGASIAAADLADHALRLTPAERADDRRRRLVAAARAHSAAGDGARARILASDLLRLAETGAQRAEALLVGAEFETPEASVPILERALAEASGNPQLEAAAHAALAEHLYFSFSDRAQAHHHAEAALHLADELGHASLRAEALSIVAVQRLSFGEPDALELAQAAFRLATDSGDPALLRRASQRLAHVLAWVAKADVARAWLESHLAGWTKRDEVTRQLSLWYLSLVELWAGRWAIAEGHIREAMQIASDYGPPAPQDFYPAALLALHRGELDMARALTEQGLAASGGHELLSGFSGILGAVELWSGRVEAAADHFLRAERSADELGTHEPGMRPWRREQVEALLQLGRLDEAASLVEDWEGRARRGGRARITAQAVFCRGLVAAARGEGPEALALLEEAVELLRRAGDPYGFARAQLALGINRRRARQKRSAREALEAALAGFEALGAAYWAAAARTELARVGGRRRLVGLSPSEASVAALVADGRTNREIAAALYLGERTVASHLTHIYAKLGVRSRTELTREFLRAANAAGGSHSAPRAAGKVQTS